MADPDAAGLTGIKVGRAVFRADPGASGSTAMSAEAASGGSVGTESGSGSAGFGSTTSAVPGRAAGGSIGSGKGVGVSMALSDSKCCRVTARALRSSASRSGVGETGVAGGSPPGAADGDGNDPAPGADPFAASVPAGTGEAPAGRAAFEFHVGVVDGATFVEGDIDGVP